MFFWLNSSESKTCICPVPGCFAKSNSLDELTEHLALEHKLKTDGSTLGVFIKNYSSNYFQIDATLLSPDTFAHVCTLCKKASDHLSNTWTFQTSTTDAENEEHIKEHLGIEKSECKACGIRFKTAASEENHVKTAHEGQRLTIINLSSVLHGDMENAVNWHEFQKKIQLEFEVSMEMARKAGAVQLSSVADKLDLAAIDVCSIWDYAGSIVTVLKSSGNWEKTIRCIQVSTAKEISNCWAEISDSFDELVCHKNASISLAALCMRSNDQQWKTIVEDFLGRTELRDALYKSESAGQFVRKLLAVKNLPPDRFIAFSNAFIVDGNFEEGLLKSKYSSLFFSAFASLPGPAAKLLCTYASDKVTWF